jgi:thiamine biosynthesis lipoprotein
MNFEIWGLSGSLHTEREAQMAHAEQRLWYWITQFDAACNRFRSDSEISRLNASPTGTYAISEIFELALAGALRAGRATDGLCDPTVLPALLALGYDRDYDELLRRDQNDGHDPVKPLGLGAICLDREGHTVSLAPDCQLDLGASAKALVVDFVANEIGSTGGVVVEIGGDVAVRGESAEGPWAIGISDTLTTNGREPRVSVDRGGIATSSLTTRTWRSGDRVANHIIDPRTGSFAAGVYSTATVSAESCLMANAFSTAALLWGEDAGYYIGQAGWSARLVRADGTAEFVGGWPRDGERS